LTQNGAFPPSDSFKNSNLTKGSSSAYRKAARERHSQDGTPPRMAVMKKDLSIRGEKSMGAEKLGNFELDLTIDIEELEQKIAPDGGETVVGLPLPKKTK
jgi:hypothetical protein